MTAATARLNMRVKEEALDRIREAAEISGTDVTAFVISAATTQARQVILEDRALKLTPREIDQLEELAAADRTVPAALIDAARRLEKLEETGTIEIR